MTSPTACSTSSRTRSTPSSTTTPARGHTESWDFDALWTELKTLYPVGVTIDEVVAEAGHARAGSRPTGLKREILSDAHDRVRASARRRSAPPATRELERRVVLQVLDRRWRDHLYEMDYLKDGIGLRAMAQRDPLIEYQREGYQMFQAMMGQIKEESVGYLYNLEVEVRRPPRARATDRRGRGEGPRRDAGRGPAAAVLRRERRRRGRGAQRPRSGAAGGDQPAAPGRGSRSRPRPPPAAVGRGAARSVRPADRCAPAPAAAPQNRAQRRAADKKK